MTEHKGIGTRGRAAVTERFRTVTEKQHEAMVKAFDKSIEVFIETIAESIRGHVDTGMSMASLSPLADYIGYGLVINSKRQVGNTYDSYSFPAPYPAKKSKSLGRMLGGKGKGTGGGRGFHVLYGGPHVPKFYFEYNITVLQHYFMESGLASFSATDAIPRAIKAMEEEALKRFKKIFSRTFDFVFDNKSIEV